MHHLIKDTEITKILHNLFQIKGIYKRKVMRLRNFIEAACYMSRAGSAWRLLPKSYGSWQSLHKRFKQWSERNTWKQLFEKNKIDPDFEYVMIDSTIVKAHACAAGYGKNSQEKEALGRNKGVLQLKFMLQLMLLAIL